MSEQQHRTEPPATGAGSTPAQSYRDALEDYAERLENAADPTDEDALRALERRIADHLVEEHRAAPRRAR
jgi:hypothetical protein